MAKVPFQNPAKPELRIVESIQQDTQICDVQLTPGPVRQIPASGNYARAKADTAPNGRFYGIITHKTPGKVASTAIRRGVLFGYNFTGINFDVDIYVDDDGDLNTTPGTVTVRVGRVMGMGGNLPGQPRHKALSVEG